MVTKLCGSPHLTLVAALPLCALRALRQGAGGGVAARVGALLCGHGSMVHYSSSVDR